MSFSALRIMGKYTDRHLFSCGRLVPSSISPARHFERVRIRWQMSYLSMADNCPELRSVKVAEGTWFIAQKSAPTSHWLRVSNACIQTNFLAPAFVSLIRLLFLLEIFFSSYRQVSCLASASIQPIESNLLPRFLMGVFGMTSTEKNAKEKF